MSPRRPVVGVMGAGEGAAPGAVRLAEELGAAISRRGWVLLSGGRPVGVMATACRGAMGVEGHRVIGVLPGVDGPTAEVDVALFTGLGQARNVINVLSADGVVVCGGGGAGTASEVCHAIKAGRPLVLLGVPSLWEAFFSALADGVCCCPTVEECCRFLEGRFGAGS